MAAPKEWTEIKTDESGTFNMFAPASFDHPYRMYKTSHIDCSGRVFEFHTFYDGVGAAFASSTFMNAMLKAQIVSDERGPPLHTLTGLRDPLGATSYFSGPNCNPFSSITMVHCSPFPKSESLLLRWKNGSGRSGEFFPASVVHLNNRKSCGHCARQHVRLAHQRR